MAAHTKPFGGSDEVVGSPRIPMTVRIVDSTGRWLRPSNITVGVPCPGMWAPDVSMTWVRYQDGMSFSIRFLPDSRFMKEFVVIIPTNPAGWPRPLSVTESSNKACMNGAAREYFPRHASGYRAR